MTGQDCYQNKAFPTTLFLDSIDRWIETMVADDRGGDDFMSRFVNAKVIAKENGIICGHTIIERLVEKYASDCSIQWMLEEGDEIISQDTILEISGNSTEILKIERVLLNILGRLSGISTSTPIGSLLQRIWELLVQERLIGGF